jgi:hypothetical protein
MYALWYQLDISNVMARSLWTITLLCNFLDFPSRKSWIVLGEGDERQIDSD